MENSDWHSRVYRKIDRISGLKNAEWRLLRDNVFRRDKWICQRCDQKFRLKKLLTAHHIVPRVNDGSNEMSNLITLCNPCHDYVEINQLRNKAEIIGSFDDGIKIEVNSQVDDGKEPDPYNRPEWHRWVYGGGRNPMMDGARNDQK